MRPYSTSISPECVESYQFGFGVAEQTLMQRDKACT